MPTASVSAALRLLTFALGALLLLGGCVLGYIAVVALRRGEGVFMPAGYTAIACLAGGAFLVRMAARA